jgi:hypothetical protein
VFRRKEVRGNEPTIFIRDKFPHVRTNDNGGKIRPERIKVNFDAICRITGKTMRVCHCIECEEERAKSGA